MTMALVHTLLCLLAGVAMWMAWRVMDRQDKHARWIYVVGFAGRAISGIALFWISYLELPIFSRLQMGGGHWFFATDGRRYLHEAIAVGDRGLMAILFHIRTGASVSYVQALAAFTMLFGDAASVGFLLNMFAYIGTCLILVKWRNSMETARVPGLIALAAVSLSPSAILWSTQPLKDTLFQFLIVSIIAAGALWQQAWRDRPAVNRMIIAALALIAAIFLASGIRWYFGFVTLIAAALFFVFTAFTARAKWRAAVAGVALLFLLTQSHVISASAYLPYYLQNILVPWKDVDPELARISADRIGKDIDAARSGFENAGGATSIGIGGPLTKIDEGREIVPKAAPVTDDDFTKLAAAETAVIAAKATTPAPEPVQTAAVPTETAADVPPATMVAASREPQSGSDEAEARSGEEVMPAVHTLPVLAAPHVPHVATTSASIDAARSAAPVAAGASDPAPRAHAPAPQPQPVQVADVATAPAPAPQTPAPTSTAAPSQAPRAAVTTSDAHSSNGTAAAPPAPRLIAATETAAAKVAEAPKHTPAKARPKKRTTSAVSKPASVPQQSAQLVPAPAVTATQSPAPVAPAPVATAATSSSESEGGMGDGVIVLPTSTVGRILAGTVAVLLPSSVARKIGLLEMGGGRGFWWFTDVDTLAFDILFVIALVFIVRGLRRERGSILRNPVLLFLIAVAAVAGPVTYTITNYGTLFRLRLMFYTLVALVPLVVAMAQRAPAEQKSDEPAQ